MSKQVEIIWDRIEKFKTPESSHPHHDFVIYTVNTKIYMYVASKNASSENLETIRFLTNRFGRTQHRLLPQHQISISVYGKREKSTNWQIDNVISSSYNIVDDRSTSVCSFSISARESGCPNWWTSALDMSVPDISILYTPSCN